jgi:tRNA(Arg) A34 adenosine deaminase TadA
MSAFEERFMRRAIELARTGMNENAGGPFGAVIVKDGRVIGEGNNRVTSTNDPTAHAEIVAIRAACQTLGTYELKDAVVYASCEPCPMCLAAIYWSRAGKVFIACGRDDAARAGFDDAYIYDEINTDPAERSVPMEQVMREAGLAVFEEWRLKEDKTEY